MAKVTEQLEPRRSTSSGAFWMIVFAVLLAVYTLGLGPANYLYEHYPLLQRPLEILYAPWRSLLLSVDESAWEIPPLVYLMKYVEWWSNL